MSQGSKNRSANNFSPPQAPEREEVELAIVLTTKDNIRTLPEVFDSIVGLTDRVVVVDSGSTDGTRELVLDRGYQLIDRGWPGPVKQKTYAVEQALPAKWVLLLDSDESLDPELKDAIAKVVVEDDPTVAGWQLNRKLWFLGGYLHYMLQPEWRLRLFRPEVSRIEGVANLYHDNVVTDGAEKKLPGVCKHDSYADIKDALERAQRYAERTVGREKKGGHWYHFVWIFVDVLWRYIIRQRAYKDGTRGLIMVGIRLAAKLMKQTYLAQQRLSPPKDDWKNPVI